MFTYGQFDSSKVGGRLNQEIFQHMRKVYYKAIDTVTPAQFLEIPRWVAVADGLLGEPEQAEFFLAQSPLQLADYIWRNENRWEEGSFLLGSVLDSNFDQWLAVLVYLDIWDSNTSIYLGGYVSEERIQELLTANERATWLPKITNLQTWFPKIYTGGAPSYRLFEGWHTVPRLQLSVGCKHSCSFCTQPHGIWENDWPTVLAEALSFKPLVFKYIYLDDKTFGQAENWKWVRILYNTIKEYNPSFRGFWVQTTVPMLIKHGLAWWAEYHIDIVEVGIEIPEDGFLKSFRKPYRVKSLPEMFKVLDATGIMFVPNLIFGAPNQDYGPTIDFLAEYQDQIAWTNPFILCDYADSHVTDGPAEADLDETSTDRTWLTKQEVADLEHIIRTTMNLVEAKY